MTQYDRYIQDVMSDRIVVGEFVKLAVERHINDLDNAKDRGLYFDRKEADRRVAFLKMHRHTKGELANKPFDVQDNQAFFMACLFGWKKDNGYRRFTSAYHSMARKGGKTELNAAAANSVLLLDGEHGAEIYCTATKLPQASITFRTMKMLLRKMVNDNPSWRTKIKFNQYRVVYHDCDSIVEALAADSGKLDGLNPACLIADERHAWKTNELYSVLVTGMGARMQPLALTTTTAGFNRNGPCFAARKVGIDILRGIKQDDSYFFIDYTLDEDDDWNDESVWCKPNPNIGKAPYWWWMRQQYREAKNHGLAEEIQFKTKNLNVWTTTSSTFIQDDVWMESGSNFDPDMLIGRNFYGGLDLSSTSDLTAWVLLFPPTESDPVFRILWRFYCPQDRIDRKEKSEGVNYKQWVKDGYVRATPGNTIDYSYIKRDILDDCRKYRLIEASSDPWNAKDLLPFFIDRGLNFFEINQGPANLSAGTKRLEKLVLEKKLDHGNNPVARWMMSNVLLKTDADGNIKIDKAKSADKVDGPAALVFAITSDINDHDTGSVYETRGAIII